MRKDKIAPHQMRHIKVFPLHHNKIVELVNIIQSIYCEKAPNMGIVVRKTGKYANIPSQPHAVDCIITGMSPNEYVERLMNDNIPAHAAKHSAGTAIHQTKTSEALACPIYVNR